MVEEGRSNNNKYFCKRCKDRNYIIQCACGFCENTIKKRDKKGRERKYSKAHGTSKSYRFIHNAGYVVLRFPNSERDKNYNNRVYEHRYVFEQYYKCCLLSWAHIHHKNEIKTDNRIENLEGTTIYQHRRLHSGKKRGPYKSKMGTITKLN
jgi:HNH endonuclease